MLVKIVKMDLFRKSPLILRNKYSFFQKYSSFSNRNVRITEIQFPYNSSGHIAGKLWESPQDPNSKICPPILCLHGKVCGYIGLDFLGPNPPQDFIQHQRRAIQNLLELDEKSMKKEATYYTYDEILQRLYQGRGQQISLEGCRALLTRGSLESKENPGKFKWSYDVKATGSIVWGSYRDTMVHDLARRISCPTCYIKFMPGLGDGHEPFEQTIRIGQIIKTYNSEYSQVCVEGGHHAHLDVPEKIEPIVNQFLHKYYA